jgi:hypothetical protein
MSEAFINQVTLDCLLNKEMFSKHVKNQKIKSLNKQERKFLGIILGFNFY